MEMFDRIFLMAVEYLKLKYRNKDIDLKDYIVELNDTINTICENYSTWVSKDE